MDEAEVKARAFAMPLTSPAFPPGPYRFVNREFFIVTYRTDPDVLRAVIPAPLQMTEPIVKYEFIRMPDSTGFGDYTESGQVIPVKFGREQGGYVHAMYLDDQPPIAGGRELWGFPKKLATEAHRREGYVAWRSQVRSGTRGSCDYGFQASCAGSRQNPGVALDPKLLAENYPARGWQCAHL
jgi:acetoacetate decarboxylase